VKRKNRLCHSEEIKRVRHTGRSYTHPLLVLIIEENQLEHVRVAVIAGKSSGGAVERNRVKRRLRACMDTKLPLMRNGWDLVLLARQGSQVATYQQMMDALDGLLTRAEMIQKNE
jgi:ribonuclease P protein component